MMSVRGLVAALGACFLLLAPSSTLAEEQDLHPGGQPHGLVRIAQAGSDSAEKSAFEAAKELGTVEAWDAFLSNYPSGFYADLARAYVTKLAAGGGPATPADAGAGQQFVPAVHNGPGTMPWRTETLPLQANSNKPTYAALVDGEGIQLTTYCHSSRAGPLVVLGLRVTGVDAGLQTRLQTGLARAKGSSGLSPVRMAFSDGYEASGVAAATPIQNGQVTLYVDRKLLAPEAPIVEQLMASQSVSISAEPFSATFQLDGSRSAMCATLSECGASVSGCSGEEARSAASAPLKCGKNYRLHGGKCVLLQNCGRHAYRSAEGDCYCKRGYVRVANGGCQRRRVQPPRVQSPYHDQNGRLLPGYKQGPNGTIIQDNGGGE